MLPSHITVTPRLRRGGWIRCEVPIDAASPSPTTIRYFLSGWASLSPVAMASARPWVAPKLSPPQVAKVWRPTQPIPVPKITSSCLSPSSSMAWSSQFSIMPIPQPWQALVGIKQEDRSEEHTSELQSQSNLVCRLLLEKKRAVLLHLADRGGCDRVGRSRAGRVYLCVIRLRVGHEERAPGLGREPGTRLAAK